MQDQTENRPVVLVSGANRGIGAAIVRELKAHDYRLSLGARNLSALQEAHGAGDDMTLHARFDAFEPETAEAWIEKTVGRFGRIDGLINNAGDGEQVHLMDDNEDALDRLWAVNVKAPLRLTRLCMPHLERTGRGRIVNIVSLSGKRVRNPLAGEKGVRATAICPSFVRTEMSAYTKKITPEEMIRPEDLAVLVRTAIELPNTAAMAEMLINCRLEDTL